ncbi:hypothetical protein SAMN05444724_0180 [Salinivibrio sp. ES.052]|nr:hypothetical protein SAMN05444724_0180 [Salinivibrio sp. ES.052]
MLAWCAYFTHPARISTLVLSRKVMHARVHFSAFNCLFLCKLCLLDKSDTYNGMTAHL